MAKRNQYSFSKRQREIKKRKKQEEKRLRKQEKKEALLGEDGEIEYVDLPDDEIDEEPEQE